MDCPRRVHDACSHHVQGPVLTFDCVAAGAYGCANVYANETKALLSADCAAKCDQTSDKLCKSETFTKEYRSRARPGGSDTDVEEPKELRAAWDRDRASLINAEGPQGDHLRMQPAVGQRVLDSQDEDGCKGGCMLGCGYASLYAMHCTDMCAITAKKFGSGPESAVEELTACAMGCTFALSRSAV